MVTPVIKNDNQNIRSIDSVYSVDNILNVDNKEKPRVPITRIYDHTNRNDNDSINSFNLSKTSSKSRDLINEMRLTIDEPNLQDNRTNSIQKEKSNHSPSRFEYNRHDSTVSPSHNQKFNGK